MIKVAAYQAPLLPIGSLEAVELIAAQVRACEAIGVQVLCCPEGILGGLADYAMRPFELAIDTRNRRLERLLTPIASDMVTTILGFSELGEDGLLFNSAAIIHKGVVVGVYRKRHPAINRSVYAAGDDPPIFTVGNLTFGTVICRDSTDCELVRDLVDRGAAALFIPTNNGMPPAKGGVDIARHARETDIALAKTNDVPVIRADVVGRADGLVCYGASGIVDRHGAVLRAAAPTEVGLVVAEIETTRNAATSASR